VRRLTGDEGKVVEKVQGLTADSGMTGIEEERLRGGGSTKVLWQYQPELYRLKYMSPLQRAPTYFKRYNPLAYRVASR
jgi:hypothetical protein